MIGTEINTLNMKTVMESSAENVTRILRKLQKKAAKRK